MTKEELEQLCAALNKLNYMYELFGQYRRCTDIDRMLEGIELYEEDLISYAEKNGCLT